MKLGRHFKKFVNKNTEHEKYPVRNLLFLDTHLINCLIVRTLTHTL